MAESPVRLGRQGGKDGPQPGASAAQVTVFDLVGGQPFFDRLVARFYEGVEADPPLRALYPDDLTPGQRHLAMFLAQYWGGPGEYSAERGHPRLRMRHVHFAIDVRQRDAWHRHMTDAVHELVPAVGLDAEVEAAVLQSFDDYFDNAATFMINAE